MGNTHKYEDPKIGVPYYLNGLLLRAMFFLKGCLAITEEEYFSNPKIVNWKHYYLFGVIDEIMRFALANLKFFETLSGDEEAFKKDTEHKEQGKRVTRTLQETVYFEAALRRRKAIEHIMDLIIFGSNNKDESFRLYFLLKELNDLSYNQVDFETFYGHRVGSIDHQIQVLLKEINSLGFKEFDFCKVKLPLDKSIKGHAILHNRSGLFKIAKKLAKTSQELAILGYSYKPTYGSVSNYIHAGNIGMNNINDKTIIDRIMETIIISFNIIICIKNLLEISQGKNFDLDKIEEYIYGEHSISTQLISKAHEVIYSKGEKVLAFGKLAEIIESDKTLGYVSYKVRYLESNIVDEDRRPRLYIDKIQ